MTPERIQVLKYNRIRRAIPFLALTLLVCNAIMLLNYELQPPPRAYAEDNRMKVVVIPHFTSMHQAAAYAKNNLSGPNMLPPPLGVAPYN